MRDWDAKRHRVPLEFTPEELASLDILVKSQKARTRARVIRRALRFYKKLDELKNEGYLIQAVRKGSLLQFPDLDVPFPQEMLIKPRKG